MTRVCVCKQKRMNCEKALCGWAKDRKMIKSIPISMQKANNLNFHLNFFLWIEPIPKWFYNKTIPTERTNNRQYEKILLSSLEFV